ncbi:hypothetical protein GCM10009647_076760 [Streptomyces sanglieri]|uniref:Uncharacterized protein n=1 Tax=Streptomyces sanglieri TaxID=193460 RepID=A0ABW2WLG0_9ACTN
MNQSVVVQIHFEPLDGDTELAERAVRETHQQLTRLDIGRIGRPSEAATPGSKAGGSDILTLLNLNV